MKEKPSLRYLTEFVLERLSSRECCSVYCVTLFEGTVCGNECWCTTKCIKGFMVSEVNSELEQARVKAEEDYLTNYK
jgi:hypothetical protein